MKLHKTQEKNWEEAAFQIQISHLWPWPLFQMHWMEALFEPCINQAPAKTCYLISEFQQQQIKLLTNKDKRGLWKIGIQVENSEN